MEIDRGRMKDLSHMVGETGFSGEVNILSMAVALGLFFDRIGDSRKGPHVNIEASDLDIWPQLQIIVHSRDGNILEISDMNGYLEPYALGGLDLMAEKVRGRKGNSALKAMGDLIPP